MSFNNSWSNSCNGSSEENCRPQCCCNNCNCNSGSPGSNIWMPIIAIALLGGLFGGGNNQCR